MSPHDTAIQSLQQLIGHGGEQVFDLVPLVLRDVLEHRLWEDRKDRNGQPFRSFEAFATHILWQGLESSVPELMLYCRKHQDVAELIRREVEGAEYQPRGEDGRFLRSNNVTTEDRGNAPTYALRRLKRDHPELAELVVAGKLSAHAAAIEAGFRKPTIAVPADPDAAVAAIVRKFGLAAVLAAIEAHPAKMKRRPMPAGASEVDRPLFSESPVKVKRRPVDGRRFGGARDEEASQALAEDYRDPNRQGQDRPLISEDGQPVSRRVGLPRSRS